MLRRLTTCWLVVAVLANSPLATTAAEVAFPFGRELLLDGKPMRGTKRLPSLSIEQDGTAAIDLWCVSGDVPTSATAPSPSRRASATTHNVLLIASPATTIYWTCWSI